ncbi:DUF115 domain-containing protein [Ignisphaera sp. 4213-co]|uniref:6-hydroxymethyl-7,8-dihydropterin pyrophosphokinase n=1 Tax=Ignisphaera cupida TaxID=3050454 RepID=A0ABD4Z8I2_9CREN|nr:6-hydroxymethylpterin diphosphokinase MptE-like protein [Ignisphaera sp. 4213-co]MDK6029205.1 DUF115 domain-containing protein [Ignisphaera sp. 4213-co]
MEGFISVFRSFADWWSVYLEIVDLLGIDRGADSMATRIAHSYVYSAKPPTDFLRSLIIGKSVVVFGAGPSLESHIDFVEKSFEWRNSIFIAADGATKALVEVGLYPHVIATDLDGDLNYIKLAVEKGSLAIIHAHGDNIPVFTDFIKWISRSGRAFLVTTQVEPIYPVLNFGGFTDGDRALAIALAFKPQKVLLAGMDFGNVVGKYSKPWLKNHLQASERKRAKLEIAYRITSMLSCLVTTPIYTLSSVVPQCALTFNTI